MVSLRDIVTSGFPLLLLRPSFVFLCVPLSSMSLCYDVTVTKCHFVLDEMSTCNATITFPLSRFASGMSSNTMVTFVGPPFLMTSILTLLEFSYSSFFPFVLEEFPAPSFLSLRSFLFLPFALEEFLAPSFCP